MATNDFNEQLWSMSPDQLTKYMQAHGGLRTNFDFAQAVLEAKTLVAMHETVQANKATVAATTASVKAVEATAKWTRRLVIATFALAVATVVITIIDAMAD
jgi:hypothetical protein